MKGQSILVTGGTGYIGSHAVLALLEADYDVICIDNLSNSSICVLDRIANICGRRPNFVLGDIRDEALLNSIFESENIDAVMHFAGLKAVGESVEKPLTYYDNNVGGSISLIKVMDKFDVHKLIFSSSATVYGDNISVPLSEESNLGLVANPYGATKLIVENILRDHCRANLNWSVGILRYFNPVGAHQSGLIGEDPKGMPNNLMPIIMRVVMGHESELSIFGDDYDTPDGTGIRDYIHVTDLVNGHIKALKAVSNTTGAKVWNLGSGVGWSVLQMIKATQKVIGKNLKYSMSGRRSGDVAECWADITKAQRELDWIPLLDIDMMISDSWRWQVKNPNGYGETL